MKNKIYIAIDLKSFYASVECVERGLNPLTTCLVVADEGRSDKTICLAVSPPLKKLNITGRPRLFQVKQDIAKINRHKKSKRASFHEEELKRNPEMKVDFIIAPPQMAKYVEMSAEIYGIYLKWIAPEDIHIYSIDEVFLDATDYLPLYQLTGVQLAERIMNDVLEETGIPAASGVGTNLYLAKVAMDIFAKKQKANDSGLKVAELDELSYRQHLWSHRPLTDFWQIGKGISQRLEDLGLMTMQDIAEYSLENEYVLYKEFGINAELLIDHAWGYESCTIADIKNYQPQSKSLSSGQVLHHPYSYMQTRLIIKEMADQLALDLVAKKLVTSQVSLAVRYDSKKNGPNNPKSAKGSQHLNFYTESTHFITKAFLEIFDRVVNPNLFVRKLSIVAHPVIPKEQARFAYQVNLFDEGYANELENYCQKEYRVQETILSVKEKYGKNSLIKGMSLLEAATGLERNNQIGGHRA